MDYSAILRRSFEITWRHRPLWLFGFLIALLGLGSNASNGLRFVFRGGEVPSPPSIGRTEILFIVAVLGLVVLVLSIITVVVNYIAQAALIGMVGEIEAGTTPNVRRGFEIGWSRRALRLFGADFALYAPIALLVTLVIFVPTFFFVVRIGQGGTPTAALPLLFLCCVFPLILLLIPVFLVLSVLQQFAHRRIVLANDGVLDGIRNGWQVIRANVGPVAVMWLILFFIGLVWAAVILFLAFISLALVGIPAIAIHTLTRSWILVAMLVLPLVILVMIVLAAINALYIVFNSTAWTLTYLALPQTPTVSPPTVGESV